MKYVPNQGDIVFLELEKVFALIVSNNVYNKFTKLVIICPIVKDSKKYPLHIELSSELKTRGFVICEQVKTLNIEDESISFYEKLSIDYLEEVIDILQGCIETV